MHIYAITRGYYRDVARFIDDWCAQAWPFPNYKKGDVIQSGARPIQLWEFTFPKEQLDMALRTLSVCPRSEHDSKQKYLAWMLRRFLQAKQIPKFEPGPKRIVWNHFIECTPIGIKEDPIHPDGHEML